jgi:hypothetical protein
MSNMAVVKCITYPFFISFSPNIAIPGNHSHVLSVMAWVNAVQESLTALIA